MNKSAPRTQPYLEEVDGFWLGFWRIGASLVLYLTSWTNIKCQFLVIYKFSSPLCYHKCVKNIDTLGGLWWALTGILEDLVIFGIKFDITNNRHMSLLSYMPIFRSLVWLNVYQEHSHNWRMLMVPDWCFGGLGNLWYKILYHESILYIILELCTDLQLHNIIRSVSRTPSYLEEVDASWLELWSIWSILLYCIKIICHFELHTDFQLPSKNTIILRGSWWFLTGIVDNLAKLCVMDHLKTPTGSLHKTFMNIWLDLAEIFII